MFDVNFVPTGMSPDQLQWGLVELGKRLYDRSFIEARRERFFREFRSGRRGPDAAHVEGISHEA